MAEIYDDSSSRRQQIPNITEDIAQAAGEVKRSGDELLQETRPNANIPYVEKIRDNVTSVLKAVYPVEVGAPTGPYIDGLLQARTKLQELGAEIIGGEINPKPEDEEATLVAFNLWQQFGTLFQGALMGIFEEGLSDEQRW